MNKRTLLFTITIILFSAASLSCLLSLPPAETGESQRESIANREYDTDSDREQDSFADEIKPAEHLAARVGRYEITDDELSDKIAFISDKEEYTGLSYLQRREIALERLINETLFYHYARKSGIDVSEQELDRYFISQYGDHPRLTTNGEFDHQKYRNLRRTPGIQRLLDKLRRDLIIFKTKSIITNRLQYSEKELIDRYFLENTEIDLSYTLLREELLNVPFFVHPKEAVTYYHNNTDRFLPARQYDIELLHVPFEQVSQELAELEVPAQEVSKFISSASQETIMELLNTLGVEIPPFEGPAVEIPGEPADENIEKENEEKPNNKEKIADDYINERHFLTSFLLMQDSLQVHHLVSDLIREEMLEYRAYEQATAAAERFARGMDIDYPHFTVSLYDYPYDQHNPSLFRNNTLLPLIRKNEPGTFGDPLQINSGYLIFRLKQTRTLKDDLPYPLAEKVWKDFVNSEIANRKEDKLRDYYRKALDNLHTSAIHVTGIVADKNHIRMQAECNEKLYEFFRDNRNLFTEENRQVMFQEVRDEVEDAYREYLNENLYQWCEENIYRIGVELSDGESKDYKPGLTAFNELFYLDKYPCGDRVNQKIKKMFLDYPSYQLVGFETDNEIIYYSVNSWYPSHLPKYENIDTYLYEQMTRDADVNKELYREFYLKNENYFITPDSLQLAGFFYPIEKESVSLSEQELQDYYETKKEHLYTEHQILIDYLKISDPGVVHREQVEEIREMLNKGIDVPVLQDIFGEEAGLFARAKPACQLLPSRVSVTMSHLPDILRNSLHQLPLGETSDPIYYEDSWYIFKKIEETVPSLAGYDEMRWKLAEELQQIKADDITYRKAYQSFLDHTRVSDLKDTPDSLYLFSTDLKDAGSSFGPLGDISAYRSRLLNLRNNERLNTLYVNEKGYGVLFLLDKRESEQLSFEDALPQVSEYYRDEIQSQNCRKYANHLRELILNEEKPDNLLLFWGGWHQEKGLTFDSNIPGVRYCSLIIEDANKRNIGEVSPIIRNRDGEYLLYRVDHKTDVSMECFRRDKDTFREEVLENELHEWLSDYKDQVAVEKF